MRSKYPTQFNIAPESWVLPIEYNALESVKAIPAMQQKMFIIKPIASSCGRGIKVI